MLEMQTSKMFYLIDDTSRTTAEQEVLALIGPLSKLIVMH